MPVLNYIEGGGFKGEEGNLSLMGDIFTRIEVNPSLSTEKLLYVQAQPQTKKTKGKLPGVVGRVITGVIPDSDGLVNKSSQNVKFPALPEDYTVFVGIESVPKSKLQRRASQ